MERRAALLSVRPQLAEALLNGEKGVEFRRVRLPLSPGDLVYVYSISPVQAVIGTFACGEITEAKPTTLWRKYARIAGVSRTELMEYFRGAERGCAIMVSEPHRWNPPMTLAQIKSKIPDFNPPQSYLLIKHGDPLAKVIARFLLSAGRKA